MGDEDEILEKMLELEKRGVSANRIEEIFDGYNDPNLIALGYKENIDEAIIDIIDANLMSGEIIEYLNDVLEYWSDCLDGRIIFQDKALTYREELGDLEKLAVLAESRISQKNVSKIFDGYENPDLAMYGYRQVIDNAIKHLSGYKLSGKKALNYIETKISEWGASIEEDDRIVDIL
jgi:hypothetical protein